jgi:hypothetical protein
MKAKIESYSADPFACGSYRIEGELLLNPSRDVLLLLIEGKKLVSDYKTTVHELRAGKEKEIATLELLKGLKKSLDQDIYTKLYTGVEKIVEKIIKKSLESNGHLQIPSQPVPSL